MNPLLRARDLTVIHGPGCEDCLRLTGAEAATNQCPRCRSIVALNRVSLDLHDGEILGVIGESGSGKSTLLERLGVAKRPTSGHAAYVEDGVETPLYELSSQAARRLRDEKFGVVHQHARVGLNFGISAGGNIAERLFAGGQRSYSNARRRASALLAKSRFPLERIDDLPASLSGGMQQRVQIARALASHPPVLLLDEATSGLDLSVQARILDLILDLQLELGLTVLVVTHDIGVVRLLASEVIVMRYGEVVERGLTDQVLEDPSDRYTQELVSASL